MELTGLELTLGGLALTALGGWVASWRGQSKADCANCQAACRAQIQPQIDRIVREQGERDEADARKIDMLFRMVRFLILRSDASPEEKEKILNDRGL